MSGKSKPVLVACGRNGVRRTIALDDLKGTNATSYLASYYLGDDLIGLKPHSKTPGRTRHGRTRHGASSVKFAEL